MKPGEKILTEGEPGVGAYVIESGECIATNSSGAEVRRYGQREIFGEIGLYGPDPNAVTVTAGSAEVALYSLSRIDFEARLGALKTLKEEQFKADPRKLLSDFYQAHARTLALIPDPSPDPTPNPNPSPNINSPAPHHSPLTLTLPLHHHRSPLTAHLSPFHPHPHPQPHPLPGGRRAWASRHSRRQGPKPRPGQHLLVVCGLSAVLA